MGSDTVVSPSTLLPSLGKMGSDSQVGGELGFTWIGVPGRRLVGCDCKCSMNVTWKELKILPVVVSHRR